MDFPGHAYTASTFIYPSDIDESFGILEDLVSFRLHYIRGGIEG